MKKNNFKSGAKIVLITLLLFSLLVSGVQQTAWAAGCVNPALAVLRFRICAVANIICLLSGGTHAICGVCGVAGAGGPAGAGGSGGTPTGAGGGTGTGSGGASETMFVGGQMINCSLDPNKPAKDPGGNTLLPCGMGPGTAGEQAGQTSQANSALANNLQDTPLITPVLASLDLSTAETVRSSLDRSGPLAVNAMIAQMYVWVQASGGTITPDDEVKGIIAEFYRMPYDAVMNNVAVSSNADQLYSKYLNAVADTIVLNALERGDENETDPKSGAELINLALDFLPDSGDTLTQRADQKLRALLAAYGGQGSSTGGAGGNTGGPTISNDGQVVTGPGMVQYNGGQVSNYNPNTGGQGQVFNLGAGGQLAFDGQNVTQQDNQNT